MTEHQQSGTDMPAARLDFIGAALAIADVYNALGRPEWFAGWLRRIAKDFDTNPPDIGETQGNA